MKRKLIFGSCICIMLTIFNFINMLNVDNSKLELLFDKVEAFALIVAAKDGDVVMNQ